MMRLLAGLLVVATVATACTAGGVADQPSAPTPTESAQGIPTAASQRGQDSALPARTPAISAAREAPVPTPAPTTAAAGTTPNATPGASLPPTPAATAGLEPEPASTATLMSRTTPTAVPVPRPTPTATPMPRPTPTTTPATRPLTRMSVERVFPVISNPEAVALAYADDGTDRLFLVLKPGVIVMFQNDPAVGSVFLDIRDRVSDRGSEEGLLGLAFDPHYRDNGYFYVYYSASGPRRSVISRFSVRTGNPDRADASSERVVMEVAQPYSNHNGGQVIFGPDGYLYIGLGDGGSGGDPEGNGQRRSTLLGSILRIDVSTVDSAGSYSVPGDNPFVELRRSVREEIWAYGLRNPWRFTFDRETGELWAADVGQNRLEEVDIIRPGGNYGWNVMEGTECFQPRSGCRTEGLELPVAQYDHSEGCSVTGGYVYRGPSLPSLLGAYVYGDFCSGKIWALRYDGEQVTEHLELVDSDLSISSFAEDESGELFVLSLDGGLYRLRER